MTGEVNSSLPTPALVIFPIHPIMLRKGAGAAISQGSGVRASSLDLAKGRAWQWGEEE